MISVETFGQITEMLAVGIKQRAIARRFDISTGTVESISAGKHVLQVKGFPAPAAFAPKPIPSPKVDRRQRSDRGAYLPTLQQIWEVDTPAIQAGWSERERRRRREWATSLRYFEDGRQDSDDTEPIGWTAPEVSTELVA